MRRSIAGSIYFVAISIGIGSFFIANITAQNLSTSAWIAVVLGLVLSSVPIFIINSVSDKSLTIPEVLFQNFKYEKIFKALYFLFFFTVSAFLCAHFSEIINRWILPDVNRALISAGLCFMLFLLLFKQKKSLFYAVVGIGAFLIIFIIAIRGLIVFGGENIKLFPLFEKERLGASLIFPAFSAFAIFQTSALLTFVFSGRISTRSWLSGLALCGIVFVLIIESCIVLIGAEQVAENTNAMVIAMKKSDLLGRGDILYFVVWIFFIAFSFVSAGSAALNMKENKKFLFFIYCACIFLFSLLASNINNLLEVLIFIMGIFGGGLMVLTAIALYKIRKEKRNEA